MKSNIFKAAVGLALACGTAHAAGPLYLQGHEPAAPLCLGHQQGLDSRLDRRRRGVHL